MKAEKCNFHTSINFLGFIMGQGAISIDLEKVQGVQDWPSPESQKQLQCLGFTNFYWTFRKNFSTIGGAEQPFLVWTDHRNLEYLQSAKWLNKNGKNILI